MPYVEYDEVEAVCSRCGRLFRSEEALAAHRETTHAVEDVTSAPPARGPAKRPNRRRSGEPTD